MHLAGSGGAGVGHHAGVIADIGSVGRTVDFDHVGGRHSATGQPSRSVEVQDFVELAVVKSVVTGMGDYQLVV